MLWAVRVCRDSPQPRPQRGAVVQVVMVVRRAGVSVHMPLAGGCVIVPSPSYVRCTLGPIPPHEDAPFCACLHGVYPKRLR